MSSHPTDYGPEPSVASLQAEIFRLEGEIKCLTAAAEVGEPTAYEAARGSYGNAHVDVIVRNVIATTVERCAQRIDSMIEQLKRSYDDPRVPSAMREMGKIRMEALQEAAAVIRARKDKS